MDVVLGFLGKLGIDASHPGMVAAEAGDFAILKAHLATLGATATGYEQMLALGEQAYNRITEATKATLTADTAVVHSIVGGEKAWTDIQTWAAANADPKEKADINKMLAAGGVQARAAAMMLYSAYSDAPGTTKAPAPAVSPNAGNLALTQTPNGPLSKHDYGAAVRALHQTMGNRMERSPEYAALNARFAASQR